MQHLRRAPPLLPLVAVVLIAAGGGRGQDGGAAIAQQGNDQGAAPCAGCHGARGEGNPDIGAPRLAALGTPYILEQLGSFADGSRANAVMAPIAQALSPEERNSVAAYYSALPAPKVWSAGVAATLPGTRLAERGRWAEGLPACVQCHGPGGIGVGAAFPPLAELPRSYMVEQLRAWRTGTRPPGPLGLMPAVAGKLSESDMAAVADYFARLAGPAPEQETGQ